ncbi:MAG: DUF6398 domain-containing protein [Arcicella sp.]|nr:DUF6398 domain-containing protein [Arcicella sp.]
MDKQKIQERQQQIIDLIQGFCTEKLNDEYFDLSKRVIQKLGRKRSVPFITGQPEIWAAAAIHAVGTINFLFDKGFEPYTSIDDINNFFGTKKTTTGGKSKIIRDLLKLNRYDKEFSTKDMSENNPFTSYVMVDGYILPMSSLPEDLQIAVKEARAAGGDMSFTTRK